METGLAAAGAAVAAGLALTATDSVGGLFYGVAAVLLLGVVALDLVLRPRLRADPEGIEVRTLAVRRFLPWSAVAGVRLDERSRYGLNVRTIEVDAGDTLVIFTRRALGADPRDVLDELERVRGR